MKQKIEDQRHYTRVGRLRKPIADKIRRKSADIYIDDNHRKHIFVKHKKELEKIGLTPDMLLDIVANGYNRIYKGTGNSLLLVLWNGKPAVTAIELNFALKKAFYEVKTAFVKSKNSLKEKSLLWQKK